MDPAVCEMLEADAQANEFVIIVWTDIGSRSLMNKTVNSPAGLTGLKICCMQNPILADATNAMGAITTPLGASEIYTGLPPAVVANGWQELAKHFSLTEHFTIPDPVFVSKVWFDGLSAENQEAGKKFSDV